MESKKEPTSSVRIKNKILWKVKVHVAENKTTLMDYVSALLEKEMKKVEKKKLKKSGLPF